MSVTGRVELVEFKERFRRFINDEVIPAERVLERQDESAGAKLIELKALAKERGPPLDRRASKASATAWETPRCCYLPPGS